MDRNALESVWTAWNHLESLSSRCRLLGPMVPFFPGWRNQVFCFQHPTAVHTVDRSKGQNPRCYGSVLLKHCFQMMFSHVGILMTIVYWDASIGDLCESPHLSRKKKARYTSGKWMKMMTQWVPEISRSIRIPRWATKVDLPLPACTGAGWRCRRPRCGRCGPAEMTTRS